MVESVESTPFTIIAIEHYDFGLTKKELYALMYAFG